MEELTSVVILSSVQCTSALYWSLERNGSLGGRKEDRLNISEMLHSLCYVLGLEKIKFNIKFEQNHANTSLANCMLSTSF